MDKGEEKPDTSRVCQIKLEAVTSTSSKIREVIEIYPHTLNTSMSSSRMNSRDRYGRERERNSAWEHKSALAESLAYHTAQRERERDPLERGSFESSASRRRRHSESVHRRHEREKERARAQAYLKPSARNDQTISGVRAHNMYIYTVSRVYLANVRRRPMLFSLFSPNNFR